MAPPRVPATIGDEKGNPHTRRNPQTAPPPLTGAGRALAFYEVPQPCGRLAPSQLGWLARDRPNRRDRAGCDRVSVIADRAVGSR